jgi:hypothetical protein
MTIERDPYIKLELSVKTLRRMATEHPDTVLLIKGDKGLAGQEVIDALAGRPETDILRSWSEE